MLGGSSPRLKFIEKYKNKVQEEGDINQNLFNKTKHTKKKQGTAFEDAVNIKQSKRLETTLQKKKKRIETINRQVVKVNRNHYKMN